MAVLLRLRHNDHRQKVIILKTATPNHAAADARILAKNRQHGHAGTVRKGKLEGRTTEYRAWLGMIYRCEEGDLPWMVPLWRARNICLR
jgi:hypothetical protein